MISLTAAIVFIVVIIPCFALIMGVAMSPAFDASDAMWYEAIADAPAPILIDPRIGALTMCEIEIPPCSVKGESSTMPRIVPAPAPAPAPAPKTLTGCPAIIAPSYQGDPVKAIAPRIIGDARDSKGRFMPRYKS